MATARLWVTVEYFHPYLAYRDIDWDQALVTAIPKIRSAANTADYCTAVAGMLAELHDPETFVLPEGQFPPDTQPAAVSPQLSVLQTAAGSSFLIKNGQTSETMLVDSPSLRATVRLKLGTVTTTPEPAIPPAPLTRPPNTHFADPYPPSEARLLAAIKTWGAIHYFFAYKDLMDEDWDDTFTTYLPKFIEARDATAYNLVMADLLTHLTDSNVAVRSQTLDAYFGENPLGLRIRLLDKFPIVTDVLDTAATLAGVRPGDVVKRIANESITDRFQRFVQYIPASTQQRSGYDTIQKITNGLPGTELAVTIENEQGEAHVVKLTRRNNLPAAQRNTEVVRILPGNVGYLDLDRLAPDEVETALGRLKDTQGIIFDLRGKAAAAAAIASHLTLENNVAAALVTTPIAIHPDIPTTGIATQTASTFVVQTLPAPRQPLYKGKTVALIDERTIGESEYAGLMFEAANKTQFVGAPSAGADSNLAELPLPGGISITYSTQDVRHGNGGQLQRLGLQPNVAAPTTVKGLRAGRDEPLDAALSLLAPLTRQQLAFYTQTKH
jgi:C-terminal processing protease CtpA/Prc